MKTVYAVSQGVYSDYRVRVLFENKKDAELHAEAMNANGDPYNDAAEVEEFTLMGEGELPRRVDVFKVETIVGPRGGLQSDREWVVTIWDQGDYEQPAPKRPRVLVVQAPAYGNGWYIRVEARTREAARKAASDRAAQKRAELIDHQPDE